MTSALRLHTPPPPSPLDEILAGLEETHEELRRAALNHDGALITRATSATLFWSEQLLRDLGRLQEAAILHRAQVLLP